MKKSIITFSLIFSSIAVTGVVLGDDDDRGFRGWFSERSLDVAPVKNELYRNECGSCHFAYQPGLLPVRSWKKMMGGLEDHFGDNAELGSAEHQQLLKYLVDNAADRSDYKRSRKIAGSLREKDVPLRVSDTLYFKRKHDEVPIRFVTGNEKVGSYSNCAACHTRADSGSYDEDQIKIPGVGRWDD